VAPIAVQYIDIGDGMQNLAYQIPHIINFSGIIPGVDYKPLGVSERRSSRAFLYTWFKETLWSTNILLV